MLKIKEDINNDYIRLFGISTPGSKLIMYGEEIVGMIDYNIYDERVKINYITVNEQHRKNGIARKIIEMIMNDNKGKYLYGDSLPGVAYQFWKSLGAEFDEDDDDDYLTPFHIEC